jgi:hypothetical protein
MNYYWPICPYQMNRYVTSKNIQMPFIGLYTPVQSYSVTTKIYNFQIWTVSNEKIDKKI